MNANTFLINFILGASLKSIPRVLEKIREAHLIQYENKLCEFAFERMLVMDRDKRADIQEVIDYIQRLVKTI